MSRECLQQACNWKALLCSVVKTFGRKPGTGIEMAVSYRFPCLIHFYKIAHGRL